MYRERAKVFRFHIESWADFFGPNLRENRS